MYFEKKLYKALNIPMSRLESDTGFNMGRASEISRDELNFQKFIDRLRNKFALVVYERSSCSVHSQRHCQRR